MKQLLSIILVILFAFPAWAQEGVITEIQKGQQAPFTGVLMDATAAAKVLTDKKYTEEQCKIEMDKELKLLQAKLDLDLKVCNSKVISCQESSAKIIKIKDEEIARLQEIALDRPSDYSIWWLTGGVIGGIAISVAIFSVAVEIQK